MGKIIKVADGVKLLTAETTEELRGQDIEEVIFPSSLETIEERAFAGFNTLKRAVIPSSVTRIGPAAFRDCKSLEYVDFPGSVPIIPMSGFQGCEKLKFVRFHKGSMSVGPKAFEGCKSLDDVFLPDGLEEIRYDAFNGCTHLAGIMVPKGVEVIESRAFANCVATKWISLPASLKKINANAFIGCDNVTEVDVEGEVRPGLLYEAGLRSDGTVIWTDANTRYTLKKGFPLSETKPDEKPLNPRVVETIINRERVDRQEMKQYVDRKVDRIDLACRLKSIGRGCFMNLKYVREINLPETVESMEESAFERCKSLEHMKIPGENLRAIGADAFSECTALKSVEIEDGVEEIGRWAFSGCESLESVSFPKSLKYIDPNAFINCKSLKSVDFFVCSKLNVTGAGAFKGCENLREVVLPYKLKIVSSGSFEDCKSLVAVTFPGMVEGIRQNAFRGCESLERVNIPASCGYISRDAFTMCPKLKEIRVSGPYRPELFSKAGLTADAVIEWPDAKKKETWLDAAKQMSGPDKGGK